MKVLNLTLNEFTEGLDNVIEYIHWEHEGIKSSTKLSPPKTLFKPLEEVEESELIAWVWGQDRAKIEKFLSNKKRITKSIEFGGTAVLSDAAEESKKTYWVNWANNRLSHYVLLEGRVEVKELQPTGEQVYDEETGEMNDIMAEVIVQTTIDPVAEFVEQTSYTEDNESVTETVRNPLIIKDEAERAKAIEILETYNDR